MSIRDLLFGGLLGIALLFGPASAEPITPAAQQLFQVIDGLDVEHHANQGWLVLAAYKNHHDDKPGHIVIVNRGDLRLRSSGHVLEGKPRAK
jgi:hypothetical protein